MRDLDIYIEIEGRQKKAGEIRANSRNESIFRYTEDYIDGGGRPLSISLPIQRKAFTAKRTANFFSGLLPEGFMRRRVSELMHAYESDYTEILADLGSECIGAIKALPASEGKAESGDQTPAGAGDAVQTGGSVISKNAGADLIPAAEYRRLSHEEIALLAGEGVVEATELVMKAHLSLTGASGKVGLYLDPDTGEWFLPIGEAPSTHIVKQSHIRLGGIVTNEQLCMMTAAKLGIDTPRSFIIGMGENRDSEVLLATERFDRKRLDRKHPIDGHPKPYRLHQEDFTQALGIPAAEKYEAPGDHYLKKAFKLLLDYSARPLDDQLKLWKIIVFDYLIGNTDNHLKNISLLYSRDLSSCRLAPAYDMLSTSIYEMSTDNMAFSIGGEMSIAEITRGSFGREAESIGLSARAALRQFDRMAMSLTKAITEASGELYDMGFINAPEIKDRILESGGIARV